MSSHKKLLLLDGFSLLFRSFFALPTSLTHKGKPINAVLGFANLLFNSLDKFKPDYVAVCLDSPVETFRHKIYPAYKAHRPPPPDEFKIQIDPWKKFMEKLGVMAVALPGHEADDVIGTLSRFAEDYGLECLVVTGDQDALQLVSDKTKIVLNKKGVSDMWEVGPEQLKEKYNLTPAQFIDFKALKGDSSDNIPGVPGVGDKTALGLLEQFSSLKNIYAHLDKVASKSVKTKLEENKDLAFLSQKLATIDRHAPLTTKVAELEYKPDWSRILGTFAEFEFKNLTKKYEKNAEQLLPGLTASKEKASSGNYSIADSDAELKKLLPALKKGFAIDLETTSLAIRQAKIVGISISHKTGEAVYLPSDAFVKTLKSLLEDASVPKYTHNGKYEWGVLKNYGVEFAGIAFDSLLAAYLLMPGERLGLKELADNLFGVKMKTYEDMTGKGKNQIAFDKVPVADAAQYAGADADFTFRLHELLAPQIKEKNLSKLLNDVEMPLQVVLAKMEYEGVALDVPYLKKLDHEFTERSFEIQKKIFRAAGGEFNINSTRQLGEILFDKLKLPVIKKTKTGRSTDSFVLEKLSPTHELPALVLAYRTLEKLQNTYVRVLPDLVDPTTHRIHTSFAQTIAITGRLSSNNPNLQNIPIRGEEGAKIRGAFIPSPGHLILSVDYSQIELRLIAHLAKDKHMIDAFRHGTDIHAWTASIVNGVDIKDVTKEQRSHAKAVNFGIIYGISDFGLSQNLEISRAEAKQIIDNYFANFPSIKNYIAETVEFARKNGFVKTEFGRIRYLPDIKSSNFSARQFAERTAVNSRVQGTAADIMKLAMIHVQNRLEKEKLKSKMLIQVHDELVFDVPPAEKEKMEKLVRQEMEGVVTYDVPLSVDVAFGKNWQEVS